MSRQLPKRDPSRPPRLNAMPASVCDGCGEFSAALHTAGSVTEPGRPCECGGRQRHRSLWVFAWCPACGGACCAECRWKGLVATPSE